MSTSFTSKKRTEKYRTYRVYFVKGKIVYIKKNFCSQYAMEKLKELCERKLTQPYFTSNGNIRYRKGQ